MLRVVWTAEAKKEWQAAMVRIPKGDEVLYADAIAGSSQAKMLEEYASFNSDKSLHELSKIGESRETDLSRIWCSDSGRVYGFTIDPAAGIFTVFYFRDARF